MEKDDFVVGGAGARKTLLVIGKDIGFSDLLSEYALDMAERMEYSILAANINLRSLGASFFADSQVDFASEAEKDEARIKEADQLRVKASDRGIQITIITREGGFDEVVKDIDREHGDIDLIVAEPEYVGQAKDGPRSIPAFSLASGEGE